METLEDNNDIDDILIDDIPNNVESPETVNDVGRDSFIVRGNDEIFLDETLGNDIDELIENEELQQIDDDILTIDDDIVKEMETPQNPVDDDLDDDEEQITIAWYYDIMMINL